MELTAIEARLNALEKGAAVDAVHRDNVEKRLTAIEDTLKWLVRLIIAAIIGAFMAFVMNGGLGGG